MALKRNWAGNYTTPDGWAIFRGSEDGRWAIINPETGCRFDSAPTLREMRERYDHSPAAAGR